MPQSPLRRHHRNFAIHTNNLNIFLIVKIRDRFFNCCKIVANWLKIPQILVTVWVPLQIFINTCFIFSSLSTVEGRSYCSSNVQTLQAVFAYSKSKLMTFSFMESSSHGVSKPSLVLPDSYLGFGVLIPLSSTFFTSSLSFVTRWWYKPRPQTRWMICEHYRMKLELLS